MTARSLGLPIQALGSPKELGVACPVTIAPVTLATCADCEHCEGLDVDGRGDTVAVRCRAATVSTPGIRPGLPTAAEAKVRSIATRDVISVEEDASVENIRWLLVDRGIGAVPVVDKKGRVIGVLSKTDLIRDGEAPGPTLLARDVMPSELRATEIVGDAQVARDLMTPVIHAIPENASVAVAATLMAEERVHHLLVLSAEGRLVGIVSALDIVRWLAARERFAVVRERAVG